MKTIAHLRAVLVIALLLADEMPDALIPAGNYTIEGDTVKITLNLICNDNPAATFEVTGSKNNLPDLISKLLTKLMETAIIETKSK